MLYYLIQVVALQLVFLVFYIWFLRRETFYQWNRIYLITTGLISFILPLIKINWHTQDPVWIEQLSPVIIGSQQLEHNIYQNVESPYAGLFFLIYIAGVIIFSLFFFYKLWHLYTLIKSNKTINKGDYTLVLLPKQKEVFSFAHYIFVNESLYQNNDFNIIAHEIVHLKEKHWLDLLFFEILKIWVWFNPLIWIYQKEISLLHEYIADQSVLKKQSLTDYFNQILQMQLQVKNMAFVNQFYKPSQLKKRIMMQKKAPSKHWKKIKYMAFGVILIGLATIINACKKDTTPVEKIITKTEFNRIKPENIESIRIEKQPNRIIIITKSGDKLTWLPKKDVNYDYKPPYTEGASQTDENKGETAFQFVQIPPEFPGCENAEDKKACMSRQIQKFVAKHFNTGLADSLHLNGEKVKILTMFTFDKNGQVTKIKARSKYKAMENEAKRVITLLPKVKPGIQDGKTVNVTYTLPIIFKVEE